MALMRFRESNKMKWRGSRPAHDGTQVGGEAWTTDALEIVYLTGAGETFYCHYVSMCARTLTPGDTAFVSLYDAGPLRVFHLIRMFFDVAGQMIHCAPFTFPVEVPSGWSIRVFSSAASIDATAEAIGWIE